MINLKKITKDFKVLYVEDDEDIAWEMCKYLKKLFSKVTYAHDGLEGVVFYKKNEFDIIITDLSMPRMNGLEMLRIIKKVNESQPVLITSAHSRSEHMFEAIKLGIDGYIIKPFDAKQLNQELYKIANKLKKFQENEQYKNNLQQMVEEKTSQLRNLLTYQNENYEKTLISMVDMIEDRDTYTAGHSKRVAHYCHKIAKEMGYDDQECTKIYQAGILHDVGKIATPDAILLNPNKLNELEYNLVQEHVSVSFKLLSHIPMFEELANIVHSHHERYDGYGYPRGLRANKILPLSRIMIVADAFDAMTTSRIYKSRKSVEEALNELKECTYTQFHPRVVNKALIALSDVKIDAKINQLPTSKLEKERFAYFYKDALCKVYNQTYLDIFLMGNRSSKKFRFMDIVFLKNFSTYNKKHGWSQGDKILAGVATLLDEFFKNSLVFRVFGDDFVILSKTKINLDTIDTLLNNILKENDLTYSTKNIDIINKKITNIRHVENI